MSDEERREEDPEELRSFPTIELLMDWVNESQREVAERAGDTRTKNTYPALTILHIQLRAHGIEYPERLEKFEETENALDNIYGGSLIMRKYVMRFEEADKRLKNAIMFAHEIGPLRIDTKYAYYRSSAPDMIDFTGWSDD